jgi:hypothetical protein
MENVKKWEKVAYLYDIRRKNGISEIFFWRKMEFRNFFCLPNCVFLTFQSLPCDYSAITTTVGRISVRCKERYQKCMYFIKLVNLCTFFRFFTIHLLIFYLFCHQIYLEAHRSRHRCCPLSRAERLSPGLLSSTPIHAHPRPSPPPTRTHARTRQRLPPCMGGAGAATPPVTT